MIHISSRIHGIEVGGMRHPLQTVHYQEDQIEPEQLEAFLASEYLTVEIDIEESVIDGAAAEAAALAEAQELAEAAAEAANPGDTPPEDQAIVEPKKAVKNKD